MSDGMEEFHARRRSRARMTALALVAFVILIFFVAIAKMQGAA